MGGLESGDAKTAPLPEVDFKRLFEAQPGLYMVLSPDLRIITVSDAYARATLIKRDAVAGRHLFEVFPDNPDDPNATGVSNLNTSLQRVLKTRAQDSMALQKYDVARPDGSGFEEKYWSPVNTPVLNDDGDVMYIVHQAVDATEYVLMHQANTDAEKIAEDLRSHSADMEIEILRRAQEIQATSRELEQSNIALTAAKAEAEAANRAKSAFLASMSHEIRTPLNGIIGNLELMARATLNADQRVLLGDADKAAKSLLALLGNVLDFAKIEAGKLTIETVEMDPASVVQEAVDILQSRARQKNIQLTFSVTDTVPAMVRGDPDRMRQILLNLVGNAVKFTARGGVHVRLDANHSGDYCELAFAVYDSGAGLDPSSPDMFQPFTQAQTNRLANAEGTGLGLAICRSLVETFGGKIGYNSTPGSGSTFWFNIPARVVQPAVRDKANLTGCHILMIAPAHRQDGAGLSAYFVSRGAQVTAAPDDAQAVTAAHNAMSGEKHIDMAVYAVNTAAQMPPAALMGALRKHSAIPAMAVAHITPEAWYTALRAGAAYLLPQNTNAEALTLDHDMRRLLEHRRAAATAVPPVLEQIDHAVFAKKRILVLEDRHINQTIVRRQLLTLGLEHSIAENGIDGLARLEAGEVYDAILCDCSMPQMNGYDFTRALRRREQNTGAHLPVIAMTANAFREDMDMCIEAGMDDFLSKPVTLHKLEAMLRKWLGAENRTSAAS